MPHCRKRYRKSHRDRRDLSVSDRKALASQRYREAMDRYHEMAEALHRELMGQKKEQAKTTDR